MFGGMAASHTGTAAPSTDPNVLHTLADKRITRDGNPAKRRGPKPNSKPALTRRQELNRQAQRTHRERKELYIKALEDEVLRLRQIFSHVSQDKDRLADENSHLRSLLTRNGIVFSGPAPGHFDSSSNPSVSAHSYHHQPGAGRDFTPPLSSQSTVSSASPPSYTTSTSQPAAPGDQAVRHLTPEHVPAGKRLDYNQAGIDFVLTLERPCMAHLPWLLDQASEPGSRACGHTLMASCPPRPLAELTDDIPFGHFNANDSSVMDRQTWRPSEADLTTLLHLSKRLDLDGEITPVVAWGMIMAHPRFAELREEDLAKITEDLAAKVRCYGFGAVMEEFEVRDALENVLPSGQVY